MRPTAYLLDACMVLFGCCASARADEPARDLVRDGMRQARASIHTIQATIRVEEIGAKLDPEGEPSAVPAVVEWWQDGETVRNRATLPQINRVDDRVWKDGVRKCLLSYIKSPPKPTLTAVIGPSEDFYEDILNLWSITLFEIPLLRSHPPMTRMLEPPYYVKVEKDTTRGGTMYAIDFELEERLPHRKGRIYVDAARNYIVTRFVLYRKPWGSTIKGDYEAEVREYNEVAAGVYFPTTIERGQVVDGVRQNEVVYRITNLRVNQPIGAPIFDLKFPAGTSVANHFSGTAYLAGTNEQPVTPEQPLRKANLEHFRGSGRFQTGDPRGSPSRAGLYWVVGGGVVLVVAVALLSRVVFARIRRRRLASANGAPD